MSKRNKFKKYLINNSFKSGIIIGVIFFLLSFISIIGLISLFSTMIFSLLIGGFTVILIIILSRLLNSTNNLLQELSKTENELQATVGLNKLTELPLNFGGWAITAQFMENVVYEIYLNKPNLIVECGSGTSTIISAACLKDIGRGKVISLDHEELFADRTRKLLAKEKLEGYSTVATVPLEDYKLKDGRWKWYGADLGKIIKEPIDILIVDGPPQSVQFLSRYPAVPLLKEFFADDCIIMLDDGLREDERIIANKWASILNADDPRLNNKGRGFWTIEINRSNE